MNKGKDFLRILLIPFVPVYFVLMQLRNFLFDKKIFNEKKTKIKIIAVGNLSVGGSGKTPMVIYLANLLKKMNHKPGIISRGYGRRTKGYKLVSKGDGLLCDVDSCGDEMYETVLSTGVPAAVSENRIEGVSKLIEDSNIDSIILDDAFQHRWIGRDLNILMFDQKFITEAPKLRRTLLPTGNLRENFSSTKRADVVIVNRKFSPEAELPDWFLAYVNDKPLFKVYYTSVGFYDLKSRTFYNTDEFIGQESVVVTGLANPKSFLTILKQMKIKTTNKLLFSDHKDYNEKDIQYIRKQFYATNAHSVLTTKKDAVKLTKFNRELDDIDIYYLKILLKVEKEKEFEEIIKRIF